MKINTDTKDLILIMLIWCILFFPAYFLWYDFRNFTNCFTESLSIAFGNEPIHCNINDYNRMWEVFK
jgi:hypothetical protein